MASTIERTVAARLEDVRTAEVLTQHAMSARCGCSLRAWQNYATAQRAPPVSLIRALYVHLRVSPVWLLTGDGPMRAAGDGVEEPAAAYGAGLDPRARGLVDALLGWWRRATPDERVWLEVELRRKYPELFSGSGHIYKE